MKEKKGQVAIIIILVVVILVGVGMFMLFKANSNEVASYEARSIGDYISNCVDSVTQESVYFIGLQGGYYDVPSPKYNYEFIEIPIYWNEGIMKVPSEEIVLEELGKYVSEKLSECVSNNDKIKNQGYRLEERDVSADVKIEKGEVIFDIKYPISVSNGDYVEEFDSFGNVVKLDLGNGIEFSKIIIEEQKRTVNSFPVGYLTDLSYKEEFDLDIVNLEDDMVLLSLAFEGVDDRDFVYSFILKYDWSDLNEN